MARSASCAPGELALEVSPAALPALADRVDWRPGRAARCRCSPPTSARATGASRLHHVWSLPALRRVPARVGAGRPGASVVSLDRREASGRELVRARGHGLLRPRARGPSQPGAGRAARRLAGGRLGAAQGLRRPTAPCPRVAGDVPPVPAGHRRGRLPGARSGRSTPASSSPGTSASASPASRSCTCSCGCSTSTRAPRSASSGCRGGTGCSSPSRFRATPRSATRSPTPTRSSGWPTSTVPPRARALRVVLLELERIYNHTADIGALATDVAFTVPASRAQALREGLVRAAGAAVRHAAAARHGGARRRQARPAGRGGATLLRRTSSGFETRVRRPRHAARSTPARSPTASTARASSRPGRARPRDRRDGRARVRPRRGPPARPSARRVRRACASRCPSRRAATCARG